MPLNKKTGIIIFLNFIRFIIKNIQRKIVIPGDIRKRSVSLMETNFHCKLYFLLAIDSSLRFTLKKMYRENEK